MFHFWPTAIYSGDYKWFETESEEELESESPTGSPSHDRTPSPSEQGGDRTATTDTGDKGTLFCKQKWTLICLFEIYLKSRAP